MSEQSGRLDLVFLKVVGLKLTQDFLIDLERAGDVSVEHALTEGRLVMPLNLVHMSQARLVAIPEGIELTAIAREQIGIKSAGLLPLAGLLGLLRLLTQKVQLGIRAASTWQNRQSPDDGQKPVPRITRIGKRISYPCIPCNPWLEFSFGFASQRIQAAPP